MKRSFLLCPLSPVPCPLILLFVLMLGCLASLRAQEDADEIEGLSCVTKEKGLAIHLAVYQARAADEKEWATYCQDIPRAGKTTLVFDLLYQPMRAMRVAVRVVANAESAEPKTLLTLPPQPYPSGVVTIETTFDQPGQYAAIVDVEGPGNESPQARNPDTISFPLHVGTSHATTTLGLLGPWLVVLVFAALGILAYRHFGREQRAGMSQ